MIGDNLEIYIEFNDFKDIKSINEHVIYVLKKLIKQSKVYIKQPQEESSYVEILIEYQNDYEIPANLFICYYLMRGQTAKQISLSAYNHPAGEIMIDYGELLCKKLSKGDFIKKTILTNDSIYSIKELFEKVNNDLTKSNIVSMFVK